MQLQDPRGDVDQSCTMQYMQSCSSVLHALCELAELSELSMLSCMSVYTVLHCIYCTNTVIWRAMGRGCSLLFITVRVDIADPPR